MLRRTSLRRGPALLRRTRMRPRNPARRAKRMATAFGEQAQRCRESPCVFCVAVEWKQETCSVPHHWPTRARGGLDEHTGPVCVTHHEMVHRVGHNCLCRRYGVDWDAVLVRMGGGVVDDSPVSSLLGVAR